MKNNYFIDSIKIYADSKSVSYNSYYMKDNKTITFKCLFDYLFTDSILCNNIEKLDTTFYENPILGSAFNDDEPNIYYQFYIVNPDLHRIEKYQEYLQEKKEVSCIDLFYCEPLDIYILGVTHFGTSWDCVATSIEVK